MRYKWRCNICYSTV